MPTNVEYVQIRTPGIRLSGGLNAVPTGSTPFTTTDTWIEQVVVANTTGAQVSFTVQDRQSTPRAILALLLDANTTEVVNFPQAVKMLGGISWVAGSTGVNAEIRGYKLP